jgi:hypothetical protein
VADALEGLESKGFSDEGLPAIVYGNRYVPHFIIDGGVVETRWRQLCVSKIAA